MSTPPGPGQWASAFPAEPPRAPEPAGAGASPQPPPLSRPAGPATAPVAAAGQRSDVDDRPRPMTWWPTPDERGAQLPGVPVSPSAAPGTPAAPATALVPPASTLLGAPPAPTATGWPGPAPAGPAGSARARRPERVRVRTFVLGLLATALVAVAIGIAVAGGFHPSRPAAPSGPTAGPTGAYRLDGSGTDLMKMVVAVPPGTDEISIDGGDDGVFDIDQFTKRFYRDPSAAKTYLESVGFRWAAVRGWVGPDGIQFDDQLTEFDTASDASEFYGSLLREYDDNADVTDTFQLDPGGVGYQEGKLDPAGFHRAILVTVRGNVVVLVAVYATGAFDRTEESQVFRAQVEALR